MHAGSIAFPLIPGIICFPLKMFNGANLWCWIAPFPEGCVGAECTRGVDAHVYQWAFFYAPLWGLMLFVAGAMIAVYQKVYTQEKRTSKMLNRKSRKEAFAKSQRVANQALLYVSAFYLTWLFGTINRTYQTIHDSSTFTLVYLHAIFVPMQGFLNFLVYMYPRYRRFRGRRHSAAELRQSGNSEQGPPIFKRIGMEIQSRLSLSHSPRSPRIPRSPRSGRSPYTPLTPTRDTPTRDTPTREEDEDESQVMTKTSGGTSDPSSLANSESIVYPNGGSAGADIDELPPVQEDEISVLPGVVGLEKPTENNPTEVAPTEAAQPQAQGDAQQVIKEAEKEAERVGESAAGVVAAVTAVDEQSDTATGRSRQTSTQVKSAEEGRQQTAAEEGMSEESPAAEPLGATGQKEVSGTERTQNKQAELIEQKVYQESQEPKAVVSGVSGDQAEVVEDTDIEESETESEDTTPRSASPESFLIEDGASGESGQLAQA